MQLENIKPAYELRPKDFIPFLGVIKHAKRCRREASIIESETGEYCGPESDYHLRSWIRGSFLLGIYNGSITAAGIVGALYGLAKLLE